MLEYCHCCCCCCCGFGGDGGGGGRRRRRRHRLMDSRCVYQFARLHHSRWS